MSSGQSGFVHLAYRNSSGLVISAICGQSYTDRKAIDSLSVMLLGVPTRGVWNAGPRTHIRTP
jgi:hypothetical protein